MFVKLKSFLRDDFFRNYITITLSVASLVLNIASFVILTLFINSKSSVVILHYNAHFGVDLIGFWWQTYLVPSVGFLIIMVNFFLARVFYLRGERIAGYLLLVGSLMIQLGLLIHSTSISLINY